MFEDTLWVAAFPISVLLLGRMLKILPFGAAAIGSAIATVVSAVLVWMFHDLGFTIDGLFLVFGAFVGGAMIVLPLHEKYRNWREDPVRLHRLSKRNRPD